MNVSNDIFRALTELLHPAQRRAAAQRLALLLGGDALLIFLKDPELDVFLPAPGFPQVLPGGRAWQAFLRQCVATGEAVAELCAPGSGTLLPASGIAVDKQVLVVLGQTPALVQLRKAAAFLPFVCGTLQSEHQAHIATGQAALARETVRQATTLAASLDQARHELQAALQEMENALQVRDAFLSMAAHELKTPVSALQGYLQLVQRRFARDYPLSPRDSLTLQTLFDQVRRLNRLIGSLFDLSRIQTGQFALECQPFDLVQVITRMVEELTPSLDRHRLVFESSRPSVLVDGDVMRLEQVLYNLTLNGVKYSPQGGTIHLQLDETPEEVCIQVRDEGIGIPQAALPHLFTQFYRAENAKQQQIKGLGIGLYVVKEIITAHQGRISVQSVEGRGTTFTICLPTALAPLPEPPVPHAVVS